MLKGLKGLKAPLSFLTESNPSMPSWFAEKDGWPDYNLILRSTELPPIERLILYAVGSIKFCGKDILETAKRMATFPIFEKHIELGLFEFPAAWALDAAQVAQVLLGERTEESLVMSSADLPDLTQLDLLQRFLGMAGWFNSGKAN